MENEKDIILTYDSIARNPDEIGKLIYQLSDEIEKTKGNVQEIKNRGIIRRLFSNNTKDLAESMLAQNNIFSAFITIIQGIIFLSMNNTVVLSAVMDSISKSEEANLNYNNRYSKMAKEYLSEAIIAAKRTKENEEAVKECKKQIQSLEGIINQQKREIEYLQSSVNSNNNKCIILTVIAVVASISALFIRLN